MGFVASTLIEDADYLLKRAASEAEAAEGARDQRAAEAHHRLASKYLDLLFGPEPRNAPRVGTKQSRHLADREEALKTPLRMLQPVAGAADYTDLLVRMP